MRGINGKQDQGENSKGIDDFRTFGGGSEGNSHALSPNLKVELGVQASSRREEMAMAVVVVFIKWLASKG